jgi:Spy/CpxP family protein refolding chaperone
MKSIRLRFFAAALAVLLGSALANSQAADAPPPMHGHEFGGPMMGFLSKQLDVTDAQKTQMKAVMEKEHATMHPLMQQMHALDQQLKQYTEGTYDQAKHPQRTLPIAHARPAGQVQGDRGQPRGAYAATYAG